MRPVVTNRFALFFDDGVNWPRCVSGLAEDQRLLMTQLHESEQMLVGWGFMCVTIAAANHDEE